MNQNICHGKHSSQAHQIYVHIENVHPTLNLPAYVAQRGTHLHVTGQTHFPYIMRSRGVQTPVFQLRLRLLYSSDIWLSAPARLGCLTAWEKIQPDIIRLNFAPGFSPGESRKTVKRQKQTQCDN